ncbi:hypothetical protein GGR57DRAFT_516739 [Xylariaceae sp. FL1272]|nr:hypothetical protein GGR57DRAFT_516739 [Xylariaceae sp. FL1272]
MSEQWQPNLNPSCVACACPIFRGGRYRAEFRAKARGLAYCFIRYINLLPLHILVVYIEDDDYGNARLSGIGYCGEELSIAPTDPTGKYDSRIKDLSLDSSSDIPEGFVKLKLCMKKFCSHAFQDPEITHWGFPFHIRCWEILLKGYGHDEIDLPSWFRFLQSFPLNDNQVIDWGHDYGLGRLNSDIPIPPYEPAFELTYEDYSLWKRNPLNVPELEMDHLLNFVLNTPAGSPRAHSTARGNKQDFLSPKDSSLSTRSLVKTLEALPSEIRELILVRLPTRDALTLRVASKAFASLGLSLGFMKSRFSTSMEFRHFFEIWDLAQQQKLDWKALYLYSSKLCAPNTKSNTALISRARIWDNVILLRTIIERAAKFPCFGSSKKLIFDTELTARGYVCDPQYQFSFGSRSLNTRTISITGKVTNTYVSFVRLPDGDFISGFRFTLSDKSTVSIGYVRPDFEIKVEWPDDKSANEKPKDDESRPATARKNFGFECSVSIKGIRGLRILDTSGRASTWMGKCERLTRKLLLNTASPYMHISCQFDFLKMISLSLSADEDSDDARASIAKDSTISHLRTTSMWYPQIPPSHSKFYNLRLTRKRSQIRPDSALVVAMFGGNYGEKLEHVTELVVYIKGGLHIKGIEVRYKDGTTPTRLGSCHVSTKAPDEPSTPKDQEIRVPIDGPGGERIQSIGIKQRIGLLTTNWHATHMIGSDPAIRSKKSRWVALDTSGEAIIGFYSERIAGIPDLGVITMDNCTKILLQTDDDPETIKSKENTRPRTPDYDSPDQGSTPASCHKRKSVAIEDAGELSNKKGSPKTSKINSILETAGNSSEKVQRNISSVTKNSLKSKPIKKTEKAVASSQAKQQKVRDEDPGIVKSAEASVWSGRLRQRKANPNYRGT